MLQRCLARLEKKLGIPSEHHHTSAGQLKEATEITVRGTRIHTRAASFRLDNANDKLTAPLQVKAERTPLSCALAGSKSTTVPLKGSVEVKEIS